jgi:hypothetical protein
MSWREFYINGGRLPGWRKGMPMVGLLLVVLGWLVADFAGEGLVELPEPGKTAEENSGKAESASLQAAALQAEAIPQQLVVRMRELASEKVPGSVEPTHRFSRRKIPFEGEGAEKAESARGGTIEKKGWVPELAIELDGQSPWTVAAHYGLVLAAQSFAAHAILGVFEEGKLVPLPRDRLIGFAARGRSADGVKAALALRQQAALQTDRPLEDIGLLYLVPRRVDQQWLVWQRRVVEEAGYTFAEVAQVQASYAADLSLAAHALVLNEGRTVALARMEP